MMNLINSMKKDTLSCRRKKKKCLKTFLRDCLGFLLFILNEMERVNKLLFPMKSPQKPVFFR